MSRAKTFSSQYGYTLHPDSVDDTCFWCGDKCGHTWDYTPHRHVGRDDKVVEHLKLERIAVPACTRCIAKTSYRKAQLLTMDEKHAYFEAEREKQSEVFTLSTRLMSAPRVHMWQRTIEGTGEVIDVPDNELNSFERKAKQMFIKKQEEAAAAALASEPPSNVTFEL